MPPVAAHVDGAGNGASADARIGSRLAALFSSAAAPAGSFNTTLGVKARPGVVRVDGDLATIDFVVPRGDWGIAGSAAIRAFIQQLVYTATEESGIRRVLITENGQRRSSVAKGSRSTVPHSARRCARATLSPARSAHSKRGSNTASPMRRASR